jgi:SAM-dependent methyltransferase
MWSPQVQPNKKKSPANPDALPRNLRVTPEFVAGKTGVTPAALSALLGRYAWPELAYRVIEGAERDDIMRGITDRIESVDLRVVGGNDNDVWERGWGEILAQVRSKGFTPAVLRPQYFDHHRIMRFDGEYIDGGDANFVYQYDQLLRRIVLTRYLKGAEKIVELGCGTGTSQLMLADLLPDAKLVASDWAKPSQEIIRAIGAHLKRDITPVCFNMLTLEGWDELTIDRDSAVVTVHALEQLGGNCTALLNTLLKARPRYCLHLEPVTEFYDPGSLFDALAIRYHRRRNYLDGWLTSLRALAAEGRIEIMEERRLGFGDRYHEAYSVVQWRPV